MKVPVVPAVLAGTLILMYSLYISKGSGRPRPAIPLPDRVEPLQPSADHQVIAGDLIVPWELAFLPNGDILVTERPGTLSLIRSGQPAVRINVERVTPIGEGGLMGLAPDPEFESNNFIYLYYTTGPRDEPSNRVDRFTYSDGTISERFTVISGIPGGTVHNGGRIAFGPDKLLYIGTGDSGNSQLAQDTQSLGGKILRLNKDGSVPDGNPFSNPVYSYGHRNVQGLAWDDQGRLWATEHGPSGTQSGDDELNLVRPGGNYGWPVIKGDQSRNGMITPYLTSGTNETWAPSGITFLNGSLFFGGLRGQTLYETVLSNNPPNLLRHLQRQYGRLRIVVKDADGNLYIGTSNRDGRGSPHSNDDKIVKIPLSSIINN